MSPRNASADATAPERQTKAFRLEVKDAEQGTVEAVFATFNVKDLDGDYTLPGAFTDGAPVAISAYGHGSWMGELPVGKGVVRVNEKEARLEGQFFLDTTAGRETFAVVKAMGAEQEWSYGFTVKETGEVTDDLYQAGVYRVLKSVDVYEVSPVLRGAGIDTRTLGVKAAGEPEPARTARDAAADLGARQELARFERTRASLAAKGIW